MARYDNLFCGADMSGYRFRISDMVNGPDARESKALGLTRKVNGRLRRYYDSEGVLVFAYSYDACIYARVFDFAEGHYRDVFNTAKYSYTTAGHQNDIIYEVLGVSAYQWVSGRGKSIWTDEPISEFLGCESPSPRARRAMEIANAPANIDHLQLASWANRFTHAI